MEKIIGVNPAIEVLQNKEKTIEKVELYKGARDEKINQIKRLASKRNIKIFYTDKKRENSQGVVVFVSDYDYYVDFGAFLEKIAPMEKSIVLILDEVQDPRNFGALIRSAEVFGVKGIIIPERNAVRINETVVKTSTGAIEYVDIVKVTNISEAIKRLKTLDYWVYGAEGEEGAHDYSKEKYPSRTALVLGSEGNGMRKKVKESCDVLIKIPMHGKINSLNVSVAGGIILSEIVKSFE
ncbi:putative TrmH family tRNA/rRNA methyltransferase [Fusobacterium sp. DD29]|uniref:23S rRNA (guanosine(2251)-2'-O)-methyltransferase RlmB n=1 Tax=unclassified Fusobacterium TaxID=2648384 RepID=UPI001B8D5BBE|nr:MULTISPECIES: 23S rRNA (guanosine(2251)-2'-O)-methyltransferase RlmB [unclassified Fusobacterium]MBR8701422.1 putative TrmH family tRNA/rRNA methyltransferase [Fusobacterium sp. DD45]MBR8711192.1 putative TrmH family tRNA/rRNA methyltransferase [Fusobacterium sp. DD28]MBR8750250.1 putative TrmH family tRNA/rRNA methyltransferase [Fusobacterium sp. DD29]MBR8751719.1 putative TrmH family tRNA/rRNA methyltransferase [Fusobacterium sp. DD26]MBR8762491.1 putative TrmH family tRNA/rRNA methyltran